MGLSDVFEAMWQDYLSFNPHARRVYEAFVQEGEMIVNDHVAFRTFAFKPLGLDNFVEYFRVYGYEPKQEYRFPEKKLRAVHLEKSGWPKIFVSELLVHELSSQAQGIIENLVRQVSPEILKRIDFPWSGRPWQLTRGDYERLAQESEYAAWVAAFGFRPNHFTVSVNDLKKFTSISQVNEFLVSRGFKLNQSGGVIKGSPQVYLEQSSTMAEPVEVVFSDGVLTVPACYYEFAKRYVMPNGEIFQGFVEQSADKIFESTNRSAT